MVDTDSFEADGWSARSSNVKHCSVENVELDLEDNSLMAYIQ